MLKTPKEIKKGLECCSKSDGCPQECPYYNVPSCGGTLKLGAHNYIQQLEAQVPRWISVEERLPEEDQEVLASVNGGFCISHIFDFDMVTGKPEWTYTGLGADPDHWMPLPEPPKEG